VLDDASVPSSYQADGTFRTIDIGLKSLLICCKPVKVSFRETNAAMDQLGIDIAKEASHVHRSRRLLVPELPN